MPLKMRWTACVEVLWTQACGEPRRRSNQEEEVHMDTGGHHKVNHRVMYLEKLNDIFKVH